MMDFIAEMALFGLGFILVPLVLLGLVALGIDRANKAIHKDRELDTPTIYTEDN